MNLDVADRYADFREAEFVRDELLFPPEPKRFSELELQARWFAGEFGNRFISTHGQEIEIVQPGVWNHEPGPDFSEAAVSIDGGEPLRGSIELDWDLRDWEQHGHSSNPAFNNVLLHVFVTKGAPEFFTRDLLHRNIPQVQIDPGDSESPRIVNQADVLPGRCAPVLERRSELATQILDAAAMFRLRRKARRFRRMLEAHGEDQALFQHVAEAFGYKSNRLPFTLIAQRLPLRRLLASKDAVEPLLFGLSGFLSMDQTGKLDDGARDFLRNMWEKWWQLRGEFERLLLSGANWQMGGQRPQNHPQRRLAALAQTVCHWGELRRCVARQDLEGVTEFFEGLSHPYWEHHFTLHSASSSRPVALVGATRIQELLVNVFYPVLIEERPELWDPYLAMRSRLENRKASVAAARLFPNETARAQAVRSAAHQQALLQVYEDFCLRDCSNCAQCPFPERVESWPASA